jgi:hypothetical protein
MKMTLDPDLVSEVKALLALAFRNGRTVLLALR